MGWCKNGDKWCEYHESYPHGLVNKAIRSNHSKLHEIKNHKKTQGSQFFPVDKYKQSCKTREKYITPVAGLNRNNEWRWIVNAGDKMYTQMIKVGVCDHTGECDGKWLEHDTECRQLYLEHKLLVVTDGEELVWDYFTFPSCCSCHIFNLKV